jgi:DNA repair protein RadC
MSSRRMIEFGCKISLLFAGRKMAETAPRSLYRISDMAADERPRERLRRLGPQALSKAELLAILLRVGVPGENAVQVGERLRSTFKGLTGLHRAPFDELCKQHGIGEAKAAQIKAAIELGSRMAKENHDERTTINSPADAAAMISLEMSGLEQECDD